MNLRDYRPEIKAMIQRVSDAWMPDYFNNSTDKKNVGRNPMQRTSRITVPLSGGRRVDFYTAGHGWRIVCEDHVDPREIAEVKATVLQRLADESGSELRDGAESYSPRFEPGRPVGVRYNTRLIPQPGGGETPMQSRVIVSSCRLNGKNGSRYHGANDNGF